MSDSNKPAVAKGEGTVKVSSTNATMREAEGEAIKTSDAPGSSLHKGVQLEGLGNLEDFPLDGDDDTEGVGEHCVVLSHVLTGAHEVFSQGDVKRLSLLIGGYKTEGIPVDYVKSQIRRLFELGAIRLATADEATMGHIKVSFENETHQVQDERAKRVTAEKRIAELEAQLAGTTPVATDLFDD